VPVERVGGDALAGVGVPHRCLVILAGGEDAGAVAGEAGPLDGVAMAVQPQPVGAAHVPHLGQAVVAGGDQVAAVGRERQGPDAVDVTEQGRQRLAGGGVPHPGGAVAGAVATRLPSRLTVTALT